MTTPADRSAPSAYRLVAGFVPALRLPVPVKPSIPTRTIALHRLRVLEEEVRELREAILADDLVAVADAMGDIEYANAVNAHLFGIDLKRVTDAVHRSNMTKVGPDGLVVYRDGRIAKIDGRFCEPDIEAALRPPA